MRAARRTTFVVLVVVVVAIAVGVTVGSQQSACAGCHVMSPYADTLASTPHQGVGCYDCHLTDGAWDFAEFKSIELLRMYPKTVFGGAEMVEGASHRVSDRACLSCHEALLTEITDVKGLRIDHASCRTDGTPCDDCHADTAHPDATRWARGYVMEYCIRCHLDSGSAIDCDRCHDGRLERERLARGPWRVTHGSAWTDTHGMGTIEYCQTCHGPDYCAECHGTPLPHGPAFGNQHGEQSLLPEATCSTCHDRVAFCDTCHGIEMPHPDPFLSEHPEIADETNDSACMSCHLEADCLDCHVRHAHPGTTDGTIGEFDLSIGGR